MRRRLFGSAGLAAVGLALMLATGAFSASAPSAPTVTVYRSPT